MTSSDSHAEDVQVFECVECGEPVHVAAQYVRGGAFVCPKCEEKIDDIFWEALHWPKVT